MKAVIEKAADNAVQAYLDEQYLFTNSLYALTDRKENGIHYVDVPLSNVIAMEDKEFNHKETNWRNAAKKLDCEGWDKVQSQVVQYFTSNLQENTFPAPGSSNHLKLLVIGQAVSCLIGNHRLAAAMVWKSYMQGGNAHLLKAKCYNYNLHSTVVPILRKCENKKGKISVYYVDPYECYILYEGTSFWKVYKQKRVPLSEIDYNSYNYKLALFGPKLPKLLMGKLFSKFVRIPDRVIGLLLNDSLTKNIPQVPIKYRK
ncbi:hypothetical protein L5157_004744 [Vibrio parahaemolyticus]|nr:hypothetical protein [Vibrio parahaemolyticus]ELI5396689.1 hypothetical protein [Vibrio parahaemolyticus]HCG6560653.1 hypothetical protein [Vibrio parahaemolyticus]